MHIIYTCAVCHVDFAYYTLSHSVINCQQAAHNYNFETVRPECVCGICVWKKGALCLGSHVSAVLFGGGIGGRSSDTNAHASPETMDNRCWSSFVGPVRPRGHYALFRGAAIIIIGHGAICGFNYVVPALPPVELCATHAAAQNNASVEGFKWKMVGK